MTPGTYLRLRREAYERATGGEIEGLGIEPDRLRAIEADQAEASITEFFRLRVGFDFDADILHSLVDPAPGERIDDICRICGCSFDDPCDPPCSWLACDLCDSPYCIEQAGLAT